MILNSEDDSVQTLPVWLQDVLVNGLSFWRSGLYLRDGRWRQFEALDCIDVDSVHNDFQREIPYVLFYPDLVKNVMRAWAEFQSEDGHIRETLAGGCISPTGKMDRLVLVLTLRPGGRRDQGWPLFAMNFGPVGIRDKDYCSMTLSRFYDDESSVWDF